MSSLYKPGVSALFLFSVGEVGSGEAEPLCQPWEANDQLALGLEVDEPACRRYTGQAQDGTPCQLTWGLAHDTHLLRLTLSLPGTQTPAAWVKLRRLLDEATAKARNRPDDPRPWAVTYLYHALVRAGAQETEVRVCVTDPAGLGLDPDDASRADQTPYGWLWEAREGEKAAAEEVGHCWQRTLVLLTPQDRADRVRAFFLNPLTQGFARIELYLQKGKHHTRQHEVIRKALQRAGAELQDKMLAALHTADFGQLYSEQLELEEIARRLMRFLAQKAQAEILLNSLRSNLRALTDHLERVKLRTPLYARQAARLARHIEQLESDLRNTQVVSESTYAFQDIQRGVEAARLERSSVLLGGAAAVLAGVTIFNSFLDIWSLAVERSGLVLPAPWLRVGLGALAAVGWPLGAYWALERRKGRAAAALLVGFLALALAVISTILVNR